MCKLGRKCMSALLALAMLVSLLPLGAAPAQADTAGAFEVTGGTSETDYSYSNGVLTVKNGANITISMDSGATEPTSDRIVVEENATATITLAGVNIKGSDLDSNQNIAAKSAIDLSNGSILTIDLSANTENTLTGGSGNTDGSGAPGIHVPDSASLIIQGNGSLSVSGGASSIAYGGVGIGGNASTTSAGEACGTVICFASGNVTITAGTQGSGSVPADDIGGGNGQYQNNGDDGQGIRPGTDGTYTVYGDLELPCDITIPQGARVDIPEGASLTVPQGVTLTNNGTIQNESGTFIIDGTIAGSGQHPTDSRYSIDYEKETITIGEGYSLFTEESGGTAIFTSTAENNTTSLTDYIKSTDQKLYLQAPASGEGEQADRREITIPARQLAPNITITINYSGENLSFPPGFTATTLEYALSQSDPNWQDVPSGAALSKMGWDGSAQKTYYFRTGATDTAFASSATTTPIVAPARPAKPTEPTTVEVTSNSITIQVVDGQEYRLGSSGEWKTLQGTTGSDGKAVYTYDNLAPGTQYTIETRTPADNNVKYQFASHPASVTVTTKYETELGGLKVTGNTGTYGRFQYGDIITVTFTPERKANTNTNALALAANTATLTYTSDEGEKVTLATAAAQADGSFTLSYDTREKRLPCKDNMTLNVSYGGSGELNPAEKTATVSLESATLKNLPTVTGKFEFGQTLTAHYEKQDDETVTYQWLRDGANLTGATEITYTLTEEDIGKNIEVKVIASDYWHYGSRASNHQMVVSKAPGSIAIACDSVTVGEEVSPTVTSTTNTGANVTYSYAGTDGTSYGPSSEPPTAAGSYTVTATVAETATHTSAESDPVAFSIRKATQSAPAAPTLASRSSHSLTVSAIADSASGAPAEYSIDSGENWQRETTFSGLSAATSYEIVARYAETDSHSASPASAALTARTASSHSPSTPEGPSGPSTGDSSGWDAILDELENAAKGDQITIDMGDETTVPAEIFEAIADIDVDVTFDLSDIQWSVDGADIPTDADFTDLDLRVDLDTSGIPVNVINTITGEIGTVQITLAHDGEFGFTMTLTAPLGKENAGYWANLYHFDESAEAMNFEAAAKIDETGNVTIPFSHASQYAIVIDTHSHAKVDVSDLFLDVAPNAWYIDAVQYAYDNGLMTGVSADAFAPEATTTRAMIVSILARLEGVTTAEAAGFADVNDEWYATAVNWAASAGVVNGYEDNTFRPNQPITREQLAAILMNYASYKGQDVSNRADLTTYIDQPSTWATETMQWAVAEGLISGVTNTQLQPQGNATRAQVAAILQRFLEA